MRSFAIEEPGSPVPALYATLFPSKNLNILKYFLSETIHAQENGSRVTHFAKFLISNFLQGLIYSAMTYDIDHDLSKEE